MAVADFKTDWLVLSTLLRIAQREGWNISFGHDRVLVAHRRAAPGLVVLPAALLVHARGAGWNVASKPDGFELRHRAVRHRVELRLDAGA